MERECNPNSRDWGRKITSSVWATQQFQGQSESYRSSREKNSALFGERITEWSYRMGLFQIILGIWLPVHQKSKSTAD